MLIHTHSNFTPIYTRSCVPVCAHPCLFNPLHSFSTVCIKAFLCYTPTSVIHPSPPPQTSSFLFLRGYIAWSNLVTT